MSGPLDRFLPSRPDRIQALDGLRGLAMLWYFHLSFFGQFDPDKMSRIAAGKPWMSAVLDVVALLLAPGFAAPAVFWVCAGFLAGRTWAGATGDLLVLRYLAGRALRVYPVFLTAILPALAYAATDQREAAATLLMLAAPVGIPPGGMQALACAVWLPAAWVAALALGRRLGVGGWAPPGALFALLAGGVWLAGGDGVVIAGVLGVAAGGVMAGGGRALPGPGRALPCTRQGGDPPGPPVGFAGGAARLLSVGVLRFYGVTALPFFLVHQTWGFRLSRSILQGEMRSLADIMAHYGLSLALATLAAAFLHAFFERPRVLRNASPADTNTASAAQGAPS